MRKQPCTKKAAVQLKDVREVAFLIPLVGAVFGLPTAMSLVDSVVIEFLLVVLGALVDIHIVLAFHDCLHKSAFSTRGRNTLCGRLLGTIIGAPYHYLLISHVDEHHAKIGVSRDEDDEILQRTESEYRGSLKHRILTWLGLPVLDCVLFTLVLQLFNFVKALRKARKQSKKVVLAIAIDIVLIVSFWSPVLLYLGAHGLLLSFYVKGFLVPALLGMAVVYLASKPLHSDMYPGPVMDHTERHVLTSRSFHVGPVPRALLFNFVYHLEHHLRPGLSRWELGRWARQSRREHEKLPGVQIHGSYLRWYWQFWCSFHLLNPIKNRDQHEKWNGRYS